MSCCGGWCLLAGMIFCVIFLCDYLCSLSSCKPTMQTSWTLRLFWSNPLCHRVRSRRRNNTRNWDSLIWNQDCSRPPQVNSTVSVRSFDKNVLTNVFLSDRISPSALSTSVSRYPEIRKAWKADMREVYLPTEMMTWSCLSPWTWMNWSSQIQLKRENVSQFISYAAEIQYNRLMCCTFLPVVNETLNEWS